MPYQRPVLSLEDARKALAGMLEEGLGLLVIPQKPWAAVKADFEVYHKVWREVNDAMSAPKTAQR